MKNIFVAFAMLLSSFAYGAQKEVKVAGMTCAACSQSIKTAFEAKPEVAKCDVKREKELGQVTLTFKEGQELTDAKIEETIKSLGYSIAKDKKL